MAEKPTIATQETTNQAVARPLKVLVPLIKQDIEDAEKVANEAASPFYQSIGEKLIEAKSSPENKGSWTRLVEQEFKISKMTAWRWMDYASQSKNVTHGLRFTFADYRNLNRKPPKAETTPETNRTVAADAEAVRSKAATEDARRAAAKLEKEQLQKISVKIIDTGYKVLSKRMHPDVGGKVEDFHRLETARTQLKELI